jgi:hypothetical protein
MVAALVLLASCFLSILVDSGVQQLSAPVHVVCFEFLESDLLWMGWLVLAEQILQVARMQGQVAPIVCNGAQVFMAARGASWIGHKLDGTHASRAHIICMGAPANACHS